MTILFFRKGNLEIKNNICMVGYVNSFLMSFICFSESRLADEILQSCPNLEIYNSCFTPNYGLWALGFCGDIIGKDNPDYVQQDQPLCNVTSLDLSNRSIHNLVNKVIFLCPYLDGDQNVLIGKTTTSIDEQ